MMSAPQQKSSKKPWSAKEDAMLLRLIEEYGSCGSWPKIALHMEYRTGKQCRERYINQLDPNIKKTPWTPEEDAIILRLHDQMGKKWSKFMDFLPGRSDNAIKNRWHVISKDTSSEHNNSLHIAYQNCQKAASTSRSSHSTPKNRLSLQRKVKSEDEQRLPSLGEEAGDNIYFDLDLIENNPSIEFDLGLFPDDGVIPAATVADEGSSPSLSPRTTNDMNESPGERDDETYATNMNMSFTYSKSSNDGMSSRESPVDPALLPPREDAISHAARQVSGGGHVAVPVVAHASVDAALPVTPSDGASSQADSRSSPTAVNAGTSPKLPNGSPTNKANLNIDTTNNSLYDFDLCFSQKALNNPAELVNALGAVDPSLRPASAASDAGPGGRVPSLRSSSGDSVRVLQDAVCWQYDPNEDLSQALEFLMSATTSPAGINYPGGHPFASSSGSRPGSFCAARSLGVQNPRNRSPNASYSNLLDGCVSPNTAQRVRPFSGNLASTASLLMRSNSNTGAGPGAGVASGVSAGVAGSGARVDAEVSASLAMPPPQPVQVPVPMQYPPNPHYQPQFASRPLPPHPVHAGIAAPAPMHAPSQPQQHAPQQHAPHQPSMHMPMPAPMPAPQQIQRFSIGSRGAAIPAIGMPEHSPMNHSHFSPACSDAKRPRGTPYTFF